MGHGEQVGELRDLLHRRAVEDLARAHRLEQGAAEAVHELVEVGVPEAIAVAEVRLVLKITGPAAVAGRVAEIVEGRRKAASA